jgi:hypothetical protein
MKVEVYGGNHSPWVQAIWSGNARWDPQADLLWMVMLQEYETFCYSASSSAIQVSLRRHLNHFKAMSDPRALIDVCRISCDTTAGVCADA